MTRGAPCAARGIGATRQPADRAAGGAAADDLLAGLRGMANALILDTDTLGRVVICQLDGGLTHTAYALLSDLITIRRGCAGRLGSDPGLTLV